MAFVSLLICIISYFLHLSARLPLFGQMRLDLTLDVITLSLLLMRPLNNLNGGISRSLLRFFIYLIVSLPLVTWPGSVINNSTDWIKVAVFYILVAGVVRTEKELLCLILTFLSCQMFRILEPLYLHVSSGYWGSQAFSKVDGALLGLNRLSGAPSDVVNPNQLAWVIVSTIPFLFYLFWHRGWSGKAFFCALVVPSCQALLLTGSRSGLLSLSAVILGMVFLSKGKVKNLMILVFLVFPLMLGVFFTLAPSLQTRYVSLIDASVAGGDTAAGRINGMIRQLGSISNNPIFGNGLGTSRETNWNVLGGSSQITHNLYIEIIQETGAIGLTLFLLYIKTIFNSLYRARESLLALGAEATDWLLGVVTALLVWIMMDLFYSFSCFGLSSWEWYFFGGVATVCTALVRNRVDESVSGNSRVSHESSTIRRPVVDS